MQDFLKRISSYNLFNYLFPGVLFAVIGEKISPWSFVHENIIITLFFCYFYGTVISRIGSLIIDPVMKILRIIKEKDYKTYIIARQEDTMIQVLSEVNNTYRTIISLILSLLCLYGASECSKLYPCTYAFIYTTLPIALLILFSFSYRKQNNYILKRITAALSKEKDEK